MSLRLETHTMPAADLGKGNPMPDINNVSYIHAAIETTDRLSESDRRYINQGMIPTLLPYCQQDGYTRARHLRDFQAVVLENEYLKAVFLPELGARLWSLYDKKAGRELLYRNGVFQPGNLGLRNAWFSGGVEFNVGIKGHNPLTCDPYFARRITMSDGSQGVRFYEYERIRDVAFGLDAWLPENSPMLYIRPRIENRTGKEIRMYWWTNIAVPENAGSRVISDADEAFINHFWNDHYILDKGPMPNAVPGCDVSYPTNLDQSLDFFFCVPRERDKWIAYVDQTGYGLIQCSTNELQGRKLFVWGQGNGGKNWNRYLAGGEDKPYAEIQAGLSRTQLEHIPMPDGATWTWVEAYGSLQEDKRSLHGTWQEARAQIRLWLSRRFEKGVDEGLRRYVSEEAVAGEWLTYGSGWGALEKLSRACAGLNDLSSFYEFPQDSLGEQQQPWVTLLRSGRLPAMNTYDTPKGYVVGERWIRRLRESLESHDNRHWSALWYLGVMEFAAGHCEAARSLFEESLRVQPSAWAARNLAMLYQTVFHDPVAAMDAMEQAVDLLPTERSLLSDAAILYGQNGRFTEWLELYERLPDSPAKTHPRIQYYRAVAYLETGQPEQAAEILRPGFVLPDIKEGDTGISDVWIKLYRQIAHRETGLTGQALDTYTQQRYPLGELDFRTH